MCVYDSHLSKVISKTNTKQISYSGGPTMMNQETSLIEPEDTESHIPSGRMLPLNSRRLGSTHIKLLAETLEQRWRGGRRPGAPEKQAKIPMVRVRLVQSVCVLPLQSTVVNVQLDGPDSEYSKSVLLEPHVSKNQAAGLQVADGLLQPSHEGKAQVVITNPTGFTQEFQGGLDIGHISEATVIPSYHLLNLQ